MDITVEELKDRMDKGESLNLIDVREEYENEEFNIGGKNIPLGQITMNLDDLAEDKDDEIILYCRSGNRSGIAKALLTQSGFTNARNLLGGMVEWKSKFPQ